MENSFDYIRDTQRDAIIMKAEDLTHGSKRFGRFFSVTNHSIDCLLEELSTVNGQKMQKMNTLSEIIPSESQCETEHVLISCEEDGFKKEYKKNSLSRQSKLGILQPKNTFFARDKELRLIHKNMFETAKPNKTLLLTGMSGVGKTQLARKYCVQYDKYYDNIVWFDAAFGNLQASINNLSEKLGLKLNNDKEFVIKIIHEYFKGEKTLYVFDGVNDENIKILEKYVSKELNSFTLITSQWSSLCLNFKQIKITTFSHDEGLLFLKNHIIADEDKILIKITKELMHHPFAVNQVIIYIINHKISLEKYLDLLQSYPTQIFENCFKYQTDCYQIEPELLSAIKPVNLLLHKLEECHEVPLKILNCLSHCNGQKITKKFVFEISKQIEVNDKHVVDNAILLLVKYAMLDWFDNECDHVTMHKLTQTWCKYYQEKKNITEINKKYIINFFRQLLNETTDHLDYEKDFLPHFLLMFRTNKQRMCKEFYNRTNNVRILLTKNCFFEDAMDILQSIKIYNMEVFGEGNRFTLDSMHNIAFCLSDMGKHNEALDMYYHIEKIETKVLGVNHPSLLITKYNIASFLYTMGKYNEALEVYYNIEKIEPEIIGISHPSLLIAKHNIASCLYNMGKFKEALEIYYYVEKVKTENLGADHPLLLDAKHNIANCLNNMGKYNEALEIYYYVETLQTQFLGNKHPSLLITKNNIAFCLNNMGKYNEALIIYYHVENLKTEILGNNHPSLLDTKHNIASCLYNMGNYKDALEINYYVEKIRIEILGKNHQSTLTTKNNIASCLDNMGKFKEALEIYYCIEKIQAETLGTHHPSFLTTKNNIAYCLNNVGKYNEALEIYYFVEKIETEILGINHPSLLTTKSNIALCLDNIGRYDKALEIFYHVEKIQTEILGNNHPSLLITKYNIAFCLENMGNYIKALEIYYYVEKMQTETLGPDNPSTLLTKKNISLCLSKLKKHDKCLLL
ncbi:uncharacterized protein LOC105847024 isoform X1 [Hydra vulgaris]|uniref:uncharacterized protein LOC105847024 isoform X1 n=1 Tax=Hydra vulgaris TaxID=6087 RepID=UPI001F5EBED0|nr:uncharacterized protein LOC105847024 [Hydra vulgaris]XP_047140538.1 uncharacterized protein LOC105847024 [Hydra vulgaris]